MKIKKKLLKEINKNLTEVIGKAIVIDNKKLGTEFNLVKKDFPTSGDGISGYVITKL